MKHLIMVLIALSAMSCTKQIQKPNVVFVLTDQWRAQDIGYAGNHQVQTPALDKLAKESVVFNNAVSNIPVCGPARASLMTGKYPLSHGVFYNDKPLRSEETCIAEVYKENGYQTAYIGKWHINGHEHGKTNREGRSQPVPIGRRQGFDYWKVHECTHNYNNSIYYDEENKKYKWDGYDAIAQTKEGIKYMESHKDHPFILFLSFGPPHAPYSSAPQRFKEKYADMDIQLRPNVPKEKKEIAKEAVRGYYAHMSALDYCVEELQNSIKDLGLEENTIFVFTSDHGDMLYSHGETKKQKPWEESILVPFLLKYPVKLQPKALNKVFSYPDIMPTLLGLSNIKIPATVEGVDYTQQLLGEEELEIDGALITCPVPFHQWNYQKGGCEYRGIRTEQFTYTRNLDGDWLLYNNLDDPYQMTNLINDKNYASIKEELKLKLNKILKSHSDEVLAGPKYMEKWHYAWDYKDSIGAPME